jgi:predicted ATPase
LSPKSQLELLTILSANGESGNAQFILATHSPILLACPKARIYSFDTVPVRSIAYEETDHYRIYKEFLEDRNKYL